jgi:hypothetical protein
VTGPAKRPSLAKKPTRKEKEKVDNALEMGVQFTIDGRSTSIVMGDLSALDVKALREQTGSRSRRCCRSCSARTSPTST